MTWKPIKDYPIEMDAGGARGPVVLARDDHKRPMVVTMLRGSFYLCPGAAMWYGDHQTGFQTVGNLVEYMDIPA